MHIRADRFDATAEIFSNHFSSNIYLRNTEEVEDGFAVFRSSQDAAIFRGFEAEAEFELFHCPTHHLALHL